MEHPIFGKVISVYTRADALADDSLVDVTETAKEAGFKCPVAITSALYNGHIKVEGTKKSGDTQGRLWDCLWMLMVEVKRGNNGSRVNYSAIFGRKRVDMKALVHDGDHGEMVITIMLPNQD